MADPRPWFLFAHGAGAGAAHPWMRAWAERLSTLGPVHTFDYPYMAAGRKAPDRLPKLLAAHRAELEALRAQGAERVVLIGKSMGSRVSCHLAVEVPEDVAAVICMGYPLKSPGKRGAVRDEVLLALRRPTLFVQGTRDPLCPLELLAEVRAKMPAATVLHVVEAGDHSLRITKTHTKLTGVTQEDSDRAVLAAIAAFLDGLGRG